MVRTAGKRCHICMTILTEELIYTRPNGTTECRVCIRRRKSDPVYKTKQTAYSSQPERLKIAKGYRDANLEKESQRHKKYHQTHKEEISEKRRGQYRIYYLNNRDKITARKKVTRKKYYEKNRDKIIFKVIQRQKKYKADKPNDEALLYMKIIRYQPCAYCNNPDGPYTIEHIVPLSKGGTNHWSNLIPVCQPCNDSRGNKPLEEWLIDRKSPLLLRKVTLNDS